MFKFILEYQTFFKVTIPIKIAGLKYVKYCITAINTIHFTNTIHLLLF